MAEHLGKARRNAMYTSPGIQNQLIDILGDHVRGKILNRVKKAQFFSVIADEVTDCSNKEQLSLVVRYVNPDDFQIREDLVSFIECDSGITGRAIADKVISFLSTHGLDPTKLRGQAYDGAGNMAGKTKGAAALISSQYPLALYLHCASHTLNLAVVKSLDEACVRINLRACKTKKILGEDPQTPHTGALTCAPTRFAHGAYSYLPSPAPPFANS